MQATVFWSACLLHLIEERTEKSSFDDYYLLKNLYLLLAYMIYTFYLNMNMVF